MNKMKSTKIIFCLGAAILLSGCVSQHSESETYSAPHTRSLDEMKISVKESSIPEKDFSMKKTYRGEQRILAEMTNRGKKARLYILNGFTAGESDEDGDGFFETVSIMDDSTGEFEQFIKEKDGSVRPLESEKLLELYQKKYEADMLLQKALDDAMIEILTEEKGP